jgi:hypothetical protein
LLSVPVGIPDGVVWLIPSDNRIFAVVREDVQVAVTPWAYFSSDQIAIKCTMRLNFGYAHPTSVAKVVAGGS